MEHPRTLTTEQAALAVGVTVRSLGRYRRRGAPSQPGPRKTVLWNAEELRAWMRANGLDGAAMDAPDEREDVPDLGPAPPAVGGLPGGPPPVVPVPPAGVEAPAAAAAPAPPTAPTAPAVPTPLERLRDVRVRKEQLSLERQELELAERRGQTITLEEAHRLVRAHFVGAKTKLAAWPGRVAARLDGLAFDARLGVLEEELQALLDLVASVPA